MADPLMPGEITTWMGARNWGTHHLEWHTVRSWDRLSPQALGEAQAAGWTRYPIQEGEEGNGFEFLMMHRAMLQMLLEGFPQHAAYFRGWERPPVDPTAPHDPVAIDPQTGQPAVFDADKGRAIDRLHSDA